MSTSRLQTYISCGILFLSFTAIGVLMLSAAARPAEALESNAAGDVQVPPGAVLDEARTLIGDVTVYGVVNGDVHSAFGDVVIIGPVSGDVQVGFGEVYVNAPVGGTVDVGRGNVRLGPMAHIANNLSLGSGRTVTHPSAIVEGERRYGMMSSDSSLINSGVTLANLTVWSLTTLGICAVAMLIALLARRPLVTSAQTLRHSPGRSLLWGVASLPIVVLSSVLLAVTIVGAPLLLLSAPAYIGLVIFGAVVVAYYIGSGILLTIGAHRGGEALASAVGAFALSAFYLIPVVGDIALPLLTLLGVGAAIVAALGRLFSGVSGSHRDIVKGDDSSRSYEICVDERHAGGHEKIRPSLAVFVTQRLPGIQNEEYLFRAPCDHNM